MNLVETGPVDPHAEARSRRLLFASLALGFLALLALIVVGCKSSPEPAFTDLPELPPGPGTANYSTNRLEEGDVVSITFQYSTNFNAVQKITLDGDLNLESIGEVKASGRTPLELQKELARLYRSEIKDDVVTVKLVASIAGVYVSGAVFRPGKVPLERPMTVMEAIMEAGGFDSTHAKLSGVTVLRIDKGRQVTYQINLKKVLDGDDESPFYLKPFDVVHVPKKTFNY
jgi:polysaccharide export outer membrane protein